MAHNDHGLPADPVFIVSERPSKNRQGAQTLEEVTTDVLQARLLGGKRIGGNRHGVRVGRDAHERFEHSLFARKTPIEMRRDRRALMPASGDRPVLAVVVVCSWRKAFVGPFDNDQ
jgi:hypothetical protein